MTKKKATTKPNQEHAGACPTCGHCKCCEKKAAAPAYVPLQYPICTRPHYPTTWPQIWYGGTSTGLSSGQVTPTTWTTSTNGLGLLNTGKN